MAATSDHVSGWWRGCVARRSLISSSLHTWFEVGFAHSPSRIDAPPTVVLGRPRGWILEVREHGEEMGSAGSHEETTVR